jgi:DNA-binding XRE family transcriptional regulator
MRTHPDLHPDDRANRDHIAAELRAVREAAGMTMSDLGALLGCTKANVSAMENSREWRFMILAGWGRAVDRRVILTITGRPIPDDGDPLASIYANQHPTDRQSVDRLMLRSTLNDLLRVRRQHMSADEVAARLGCGPTAVYWREDNPDGASLLAVQRYARAVGCQVTASLIPVVEPIRAVAA